MAAFSFSDVFGMIKNASFTLDSLKNEVYNFFASLASDTYLGAMNEYVAGLVSGFAKYVPIVFAAVALLLALFGKRLFSLFRFLTFFGVGFILGSYYLIPTVLEALPMLPPWVVGLVVGILAAVLSKFLYLLLYMILPGYAVYYIAFSGVLLPQVTSFSKGNYVISIAAAAVAIVILLLLRKIVEMAGTAYLGGLWFANLLLGWWNYNAISVFVGKEWLGTLTVSLVVTLVGFVIQYRTRERY